MNWPRLFACPDRPHLLARCRAHQVQLVDGANAPHYPKISFTIDLYLATGQQGSSCRRLCTDSRTIYGQRLFDWDWSFVDADRIAVAYRDAYFGPKTLCLLLYDISRRQFRTCCLTAEDYEEIQRLPFQLGPIEARASAQEVMADYMLKRDRLLIVSPPNNVMDYRILTSYRLSWPLETSLTLTPNWEPKPETRIRVRPPGDFPRRHFCTRASFLTNHDTLHVFDGDGNTPTSATIKYDRFFSINLFSNDNQIHDLSWTYCSPHTVPPNSTTIHTKDTVYCPQSSNLYMWQSHRVWTLPSPIDHDKENAPIHGDWGWMESSLSSVRASKLLSWPPPTTSIAVNGQGGIYQLDNDDDDEDGGAPRFLGFVGSHRSPPALTFLTTLSLMDSWSHECLVNFFTKSVAQLRAQGFPYCLARLAFVKS